MKHPNSRWMSFTAMAGLFACPLLAAGVGDPNGPPVYDPSLPLVVPSAPVYQEQPLQQPQSLPPAPVAQLERQAAPAQAEEDRFTAAELQEMVAAIALYPDPLLAQILAGATYPLDIVQASRFIKANANDPALPQRIAEQRWDPSVQALAHYPTVLQMLDENLEWTQNLGAAFIHQQEDLMAAIQACRLQAQAAGNLATTPQQTVVVEERIVYIHPADPQVIYVPVYEPETVYVQRRPDYFGHAISFGIGFSVGSWLDLDCDWRHHHVYRGGWYDRHHGHHAHQDRRDVNVRIYKDTYGTRIDNDHRHDDRHDRDRDYRDRDDHDRRENVWRRDASKPAPQIRSSPQHGSRVVTPVRPSVDSRAGRDDRAGRGTPEVRDGRVAGRSDDRPDQARDARVDDRNAAERRPDERNNDRADWGNRSRSGYVRPTTGYTRPVTPTIPSSSSQPRAADEQREQPASPARPSPSLSPSPWTRPSTADRGDRQGEGRPGDERNSTDRRGDDRRSEDRRDGDRRVQVGPGGESSQPSSRPTWDRGDLRRPSDSTTVRPQITPRVTRPAESPVTPTPTRRPTPTPSATPSSASRPMPSVTPRPTPSATPSTPAAPSVRPVPRAPASSPRVEAPAPSPRTERPASPSRIERPSPSPTPTPRIERSAPSPRERIEERSVPRPTPPAASRSTAPSKPSPAASTTSAPSKPSSSASRSSSRPSIASERAAQNAAARERSSEARDSRRGK